MDLQLIMRDVDCYLCRAAVPEDSSPLITPSHSKNAYYIFPGGPLDNSQVVDVGHVPPGARFFLLPIGQDVEPIPINDTFSANDQFGVRVLNVPVEDFNSNHLPLNQQVESLVGREFLCLQRDVPVDRPVQGVRLWSAVNGPAIKLFQLSQFDSSNNNMGVMLRNTARHLIILEPNDRKRKPEEMMEEEPVAKRGREDYGTLGAPTPKKGRGKTGEVDAAMQLMELANAGATMARTHSSSEGEGDGDGSKAKRARATPRRKPTIMPGSLDEYSSRFRNAPGACCLAARQFPDDPVLAWEMYDRDHRQYENAQKESRKIRPKPRVLPPWCNTCVRVFMTKHRVSYVEEGCVVAYNTGQAMSRPASQWHVDRVCQQCEQSWMGYGQNRPNDRTKKHTQAHTDGTARNKRRTMDVEDEELRGKPPAHGGHGGHPHHDMMPQGEAMPSLPLVSVAVNPGGRQ